MYHINYSTYIVDNYNLNYNLSDNDWEEFMICTCMKWSHGHLY